MFVSLPRSGFLLVFSFPFAAGPRRGHMLVIDPPLKPNRIKSNQIKSNLSNGVIFAPDFAHLVLLSRCRLLISRYMETGHFPLLLLACGIPFHHLFAILTTWITSKLHPKLTSSFRHLNANFIGGARAFECF